MISQGQGIGQIKKMVVTFEISDPRTAIPWRKAGQATIQRCNDLSPRQLLDRTLAYCELQIASEHASALRGLVEESRCKTGWWLRCSM